MGEIDNIAQDVSQGISSFFSGIGTSLTEAVTGEGGIADPPASSGWQGVSDVASQIGQNISGATQSAVDSVGSLIPGTGTIVTGSIILIVILVLVLMILGKAEGIGLGL